MQLVGLMSASSRGASPPANARDLHPANRIGVMTAEAYDSLTTEMCAMLRAGPPGGGTWDGVLIGCHGAAVSELHPDCDGAFCFGRGQCKPVFSLTVYLHFFAVSLYVTAFRFQGQLPQDHARCVWFHQCATQMLKCSRCCRALEYLST